MSSQYRVVCREELHDIVNEVNEYLLDGWECQGGLLIVGCKFYQAMAKMVFDKETSEIIQYLEGRLAELNDRYYR